MTASRRRSRRLWIAGIFATVIVLCTAIVIVLFAPFSPDPFSAEMMPGFVFDDAEAVTVPDAPNPIPIVSGLSPASGTVGTKVKINGSDLTSMGLQSVVLGEIVLHLLDASDETIEVYIPYGTQSGDILLVYTNLTIHAGNFDVLPQQKQLLAEQIVSPSADAQTVSAGQLSVTIPASALDTNQTLRIEKIIEVNSINLPESVTGTAFSVTIGDMHQFNDLLIFSFALPSDLPGEPSAAYFNEANSMWYTLPSEVVDGQLKIYSDHLTDLFIFYWGKAIYSPDGYFKIYYQEDDAYPKAIASSMDDLAYRIGVALEEARKDYSGEGASAGTKVLPEAFREDFTYMGFKDAMDVYLQSNIQEPTYNATTNNILLNTDLHTQEDLEITTAHELFHAYQDYYLNELILGKLGYYQNKWAVEAIAELAAYELAYPEKHRVREIKYTSSSTDRYDIITDIHEHEYDMACFLKYLLDQTNANFVDMWVSVASNSKRNMSDCLNDFFKSESDEFFGLNLAYLDFWQAVVGDSTAPYMFNLPVLFEGRIKLLADIKDDKAAPLEYTAAQPATEAFGLYAASTFPENMPVRILNVECTAKSADCAKVSGVKYKGDNIAYMLNSARVAGGYDWRPIYANHASIASRRLYTLEQGKYDAVLVAFPSVTQGEKQRVDISEIQGQCRPQRIENVIPGMEQEFTVQFKDIFSFVDAMELVVDFGDGTGKRYAKTNENGLLGGTLKHTFGDPITGDAVKFMLYSVADGDKTLISMLVIPLTKGSAVKLSASPNPIEAGDIVSLAANGEDTGYTYRWDFGDGKTETTYVPFANHAYDAAGTYDAKVTLYDLDDTIAGAARITIKVTALVITPTPLPTTAPTQGAYEEQPTRPSDGLDGLCMGRWQAIFDNFGCGDGYYLSWIYDFRADGTWDRTGLQYTLDGKSSRALSDWLSGADSYSDDSLNAWLYVDGTYTYDELTGMGVMHIDAPNPDPDYDDNVPFRYNEDSYEALNGYLSVGLVSFKRIE